MSDDDYTVIDIVNAIADDLEPMAKRIAPKGFKLWKHRPPDLLTADNAPWLGIWSPQTRHQLISTMGDYKDDDLVEIEWAISIADFTEQGGEGSEKVITDAMEALLPIVERLKAYSQGLPRPFTNQVLGTLQNSARETDKAMVWSQSWVLTVSSLGAE